ADAALGSTTLSVSGKGENSETAVLPLVISIVERDPQTQSPRGRFTPPRALPPSDMKGIFLLTHYPGINAVRGRSTTFDFRLENYDLPPEWYVLSVSGVPKGWTATLFHGDQVIDAAMPAANFAQTFQLRVVVPADQPFGTSTVSVSGKSSST